MRRACHLTASEMGALFAQGVAAEEVQTYVAIRWHRNRETGEAFPSRSRLSELLGISERNVTRRVRALEDSGLVRCWRSRGVATRYYFPYASTPVTGDTGTPVTGDIEPLSRVTSTPVTGDTLIGSKGSVSGGGQDESDPEKVEALKEAARLLSRRFSCCFNAEDLASRTDSAFPSEIRRAAENVANRDPSRVRDPLKVYALALGDEVNRREPIV